MSREQAGAWREGGAMQQAAWVEAGMQRGPDELVAETQTQVRRSFCRGSS